MVIQSGLVDIVLWDGFDQKETLDTIGKGSIIGHNMMLKQERWPYMGVNSGIMTVKTLCITSATLELLRREHNDINEIVTSQEDSFDIYGVPQIDYTMEMMHSSANEAQEAIIFFQKQLIWKEKRHDYLSMWLEIEKLEQDVEKFLIDEIERGN